jgi:GntR family transcriptional regulator
MTKKTRQAGSSKIVKSAGPLYLRVAQLLQTRIQSLEYPVGALMPTEFNLAAEFKVSRQTVRQAIQRLRQQGFVSARKGVGTRVESRSSSATYQFSLQSLSEIFQYASETIFEVKKEEKVAVRGKLAAEFGCRSGHLFHHIGGVRYIEGQNRPIGWVDVWVDNRYATAVSGVRLHRTAIYSLIERHSGETINEVTQSIRAVPLPKELSSHLQAPPGTVAMKVTRRYFSTSRRLLEVAISILLGDRFGYSMTLTRK